MPHALIGAAAFLTGLILKAFQSADRVLLLVITLPVVLLPVALRHYPDRQTMVVPGQNESQPPQFPSRLLWAQSASYSHALQLTPIEDLASQTRLML